MKQCFYGNMKWWDPVEDPSDISFLPPEFAKAKALWDQDGEANFGAINELLGHFVRGLFCTMNIRGGEELFTDLDDEVEATKVHVAGYDFTNKNVPFVKSEAIFDVDVVDGFESIDLDEWEENNDGLYSAMSFYWELDDEYENIDLTWANHQGRECVPFDESERLSILEDPTWHWQTPAD